MSLNNLDALQNEIVLQTPHEGSCWECKHSEYKHKDPTGEGLYCCHKANSNFSESSPWGVNSLIRAFLKANNIFTINGDFAGRHCKLFEHYEN